MHFPTHSCAHCGQTSYAVKRDIADIWPTGLAGLAARAKAKFPLAPWRSAGGGSCGALTRGLGLSAAFITLLTVILEATNAV